MKKSAYIYVTCMDHSSHEGEGSDYSCIKIQLGDIALYDYSMSSLDYYYDIVRQIIVSCDILDITDDMVACVLFNIPANGVVVVNLLDKDKRYLCGLTLDRVNRMIRSNDIFNNKVGGIRLSKDKSPVLLKFLHLFMSSRQIQFVGSAHY